MNSAPTYHDPNFLEAYGTAWDSLEVLRYFSTDGVYVDVGSDASFAGHDQIAHFVRLMLAFAPDSKVDFTSIIPGDHGFAAEWTWSGTAKGPLRMHGVLHPSTGKEFSVIGAAVCTVDDRGAITSHKDFWDTSALLRQLGLD